MDEARPRQFHERFGIEVRIDEAKRRFVDRVSNAILDGFSEPTAIIHVANALGEKHPDMALVTSLRYRAILDEYVSGDFYRCLRVIEAAYDFLERKGQQQLLTEKVNQILSTSELDLGISWQPPILKKASHTLSNGAKLAVVSIINTTKEPPSTYEQSTSRGMASSTAPITKLCVLIVRVARLSKRLSIWESTAPPK
jgi:hypothetical protein